MTAATPGQAAFEAYCGSETQPIWDAMEAWQHRKWERAAKGGHAAIAAQEPHAAPGPLRARVGAVAHGLETAAGPSLTRAQQIKAGIARTLREILDETKQEEPQPAPELADYVPGSVDISSGERDVEEFAVVRAGSAAPEFPAAGAALARVLSWFTGNGTRREASATRAQLARAHADGGLTVPEELRRFL